MAGRLVDVSGRSGQAHFEEQIRGAWSSALTDIPRYLAADAGLAERFAQQLAAAASRPQHATLLFALVDDAGKDTIVGEFFQNAELEQLSQLGSSNPDILRLFARVSGAETEPSGIEPRSPLIEFGLASVAVPAGEPAAGSAVVTETHVFPGAWEGPDSPGILRDLVRIHEALTRTGARKPLERYGQPQIQLWLASQEEDASETAPANPAAASEVSTPATPVAPASQPANGQAADNRPASSQEAETQPPASAAMPAAASLKAESPQIAPKPAPPPIPAVAAKKTTEPGAATPSEPAKAAAPKPAANATPVTPRATAPASAEKPKPAPEPYRYTMADEPAAGSNRAVLLAVGGGVVAVALAVGAYFFMGSNGADKPQTASTPSLDTPSATPAAAPSKSPATTAPVNPPAQANSQNGNALPSGKGSEIKKTTDVTTAAAKTPATSTAATSGATAVAPAAPGQADPAATPPAPAANTNDTGTRRAAALDALGLDGQDKEDKRRSAVKALTGQ